MEYGIQRRTIYLVPPDSADFEYIFAAFDDPNIYRDLGLNEPSGAELRRRHAEGNHVFGIIREVSSRTRIGFVVIFPPTPAFEAWSFAYAIPEATHRNAFAAMHSADAMAHYMFEHLRIDALGWETREGKTAADAVVRRLGYRAVESREINGNIYRFYRITRDEWMARRKKLDAGEKSNPSGLGATFRKLMPPYQPL